MEWKPATIDEVKEIVKADLKRCNADQVAVFQQYSVEPLLAPIVRNGKEESVVVVARKSNEVIYWEESRPLVGRRHLSVSGMVDERGFEPRPPHCEQWGK